MTARLPHPGTKITAICGDDTVHGVVDDYEHHNPHQVTFPVKFGNKTMIMLASDITVLPDHQQPDDRQPPRHTGYYEHQACSSCEQGASQ